MKIITVFCLAFLAVVSSMSHKDISIPALEKVGGSPRFIEGIVVGIVEDLTEQIREGGFDPFEFSGLKEQYALPVPSLLHAQASISDVRSTGISNIVVNHINFSLFPPTTLTLDISLPHIEIFIGEADFNITVLAENFQGRIKDISFGVNDVGVSGSIGITIGIISGISFNNVNLEFNLGGLTFDGYVNLFGIDLSSAISNLITVGIPYALHELRYEVNELVEIIVWAVLENFF